MTDVAQVAKNIQTRTHDDGFAWLNRNSNLKQTIQDFKNLSPEERNQVASRLSDALGDYTGALRNGLQAQNADATATGGMIKGIVGVAISALSLGRASGSATFLTNSMVDAAVNSANSDRTKLGQVLQDLAVPVDANGNRYEGPATSTFDASLARVRAG